LDYRGGRGGNRSYGSPTLKLKLALYTYRRRFGNRGYFEGVNLLFQAIIGYYNRIIGSFTYSYIVKKGVKLVNTLENDGLEDYYSFKLRAEAKSYR